MHCGYELRCVKITAINLGLRGRYGWVVCGNSLSGETQFAYRVGSFYNETPAGLRRGVIRDVPPEQSPIAVLSQRTGRDARNLLDDGDAHEADTGQPVPTIIEVPQWLARLEPGLAALERGQSDHEQKPLEQTQQMQEPADEPRRQQTLF